MGKVAINSVYLASRLQFPAKWLQMNHQGTIEPLEVLEGISSHTPLIGIDSILGQVLQGIDQGTRRTSKLLCEISFQTVVKMAVC